MKNVLSITVFAAATVSVLADQNDAAGSTAEPSWNWHVQTTEIVQGDPGFPARYSGPHSLDSRGEARETVSLDLFAGVRLWSGAEAHVDGLVWQGSGLSKTAGAEAFPNGEAFRSGNAVPNINLARFFLRQTIGFGGEEDAFSDAPLQLAGKQAVSRLTLTIGRMSVKDLFDNNAYANDPRTQFLNWALMANEAWDYPADSIGYETGVAAELNQRQWALRYGFFQMPRVSNGTAQDTHYLDAWGMVTEFEYRYQPGGHPGTIRLLGYGNRAHMGNYEAAVNDSERPAHIEATRAYRYKFGFGVNIEQEIARNIGIFSRLGWNDGENESWIFADVDCTATLGISMDGERWHRPGDTIGLAGIVNAISRSHRRFFEAGGQGILAGDGRLSYGEEKTIETYYRFQICTALHASIDYQFIDNPAYNRDRGPVSVFGARLHWEY